MSQTISIDIVNKSAMKALEDLELLKLIRLRKDKPRVSPDWANQYKQVMSKQPLSEVDQQLSDLRRQWE